MVLLSLVSLPLISTLLLLLLAGLCCCHFLNRYAFLRSKSSIIKVESGKSQFFLCDRSGQRYLAKPINSAIIHPWFTLLSFSCEALEQEQPSQHKASLTEKHILTKKHTLAEKHPLAELVEALCKRMQYSACRKDIRHVIICRYNADNLDAYRRLRVLFKFS